MRKGEGRGAGKRPDRPTGHSRRPGTQARPHRAVTQARPRGDLEEEQGAAGARGDGVAYAVVGKAAAARAVAHEALLTPPSPPSCALRTKNS